ncbi:sensor histidine kinase [Burkholderia sp. Ax-1719]|uniref:sensor histidine kinase n=1 Tax=Burkholderia sp. Ax-1719 TaxID=2608334 RepID=UPI00141F6693|nr:sensor histidine kinase [Burkholderia sp. Ax-1719]NIE63017.1 sensor histidine kinase [Burkholderia sp. Ax-1719]
MIARIVLLSIASLMLAQIGFQYLDADSPRFSGDATFDSAADAPSAWQDDIEAGLSTNAGVPHGIAPRVSIHPRFVDLGAEIAPHLRDAIWASDDVTAWNPAYPHENETHWIDVGLAARLAAVCTLLTAVLFAMRSWWLRQVRQDLLQMSALLQRSAAANFDVPEYTNHRRQELRELTRALGDLLCRRSGVAEDQSSAFAAFLKLMETHAARLRAIATNVGRWNLRVALIEDIDVFQDVARQFIDSTGQGGADTTPVSVDAYLRDRFLYGVNADDSRIVLRLEAGAAFELPRAALARLIDNLVGNALAHGAPPVEIGTLRGARSWTLSVRDHGAGGAALIDDTAQTASLRASHAVSRDLSAHWGIGLSIVGRLAQRCNAKLKIGDHPEGGLCVRVIVPTDEAQPR